MLLKLECGVDEYLYLPCVGQTPARQMVNEFCKRIFNATVDMEFWVCFTFAKYEKYRLSFCETTNVFMDAFFSFPITHLHQLEPFKLIKTVLKLYMFC